MSAGNGDGVPMLRYATADLMRKSCVHCHNTHPDSPKTDWKAGDVRGVLQVSLPLDKATAAADASFWVTSVAIIAIAVLITAGNTLFLAATRVGSTSVAAVLTSLFPAVTVFWAWMVFREPLRAIQLVGLAVAVVAVSLIAAG